MKENPDRRKKLDDIVNKYKNTYHNTIKTEPADVKPSTYFDFSQEINNKDLKIRIGDIFGTIK